ncbi:MAG: RNA polymerase sigma factor, partial [Chloroflexota bacterium]
LKQGDEAALNRLWEDLYRDAVYIARRHNKPDDMGYDAAIEAYGALTRRGIQNFSFQAAFRSYCWTILTRELYRLIKKEIPIHDEEVPEIAVHDNQSPTADAAVIWQRIKACVEALKGNRKVVFEAIDLEGRAPSDVATEIGRSRNNVNQLTSRARRDVRRCLEQMGYKSSQDILSL